MLILYNVDVVEHGSHAGEHVSSAYSEATLLVHIAADKAGS